MQHTYGPHFFAVFSSYLTKKFSVFHAFLNAEIINMLPDVPIETQWLADLQHSVIARNLPRAARYPLFSEGKYRYVRSNLTNRIRDQYHRSGFPKKLDAVLARAVGRGLRPRQYFIDYRRWLVSNHSKEIAELLRPSELRCGTLLADGVVPRLLDDFARDRLQRINPITRLLSLELFLRALE